MNMTGDQAAVTISSALGAVYGVITKFAVTELSAPTLGYTAGPFAKAGVPGGIVIVTKGASTLLVAKTAAGTAAIFLGAGLGGALIAGGVALALVKLAK